MDHPSNGLESTQLGFFKGHNNPQARIKTLISFIAKRIFKTKFAILFLAISRRMICMGLMSIKRLQYYVLQLFLLTFSCFFIFAAAIDTIQSHESLRDDSQSLISNGNRFKLTFFSPPNSSHRYVGIMFNLPVMTVVWVANRYKPLNDSSGTFEITSDGNLVVLDGRKETVWSTNLSTSVANASAVLLDTGNLVLQDNSNNEYVWESFQHATDSLLENMKIATDLSRNEKNTLTSWRSVDDPAPGSFMVTIEPLDIPQSFVWKDGDPYWRSGPWNGQIFTGVPDMISDYKDGTNVVSDPSGTAYQTFTFSNSSVLNSTGSIEEKVWSSTSNECDMYGKCGPFGSCNADNRPICSCFHGFMPKNKDEWKSGNWTSGCRRKALLQFEQNNYMGKQDVFLHVERVKLPDHFKWLRSWEGGCRETCLSNCSCIAYADPSGIGCLHWNGNLIDAQEFSYGGDDLYVRLAYSELADKKHDNITLIATTVILGIILVALCAYFLPKLLLKYRARSSNQGVEEFMNEVEVISRLQHRNLVRLLGCCVESREKLLVYEYMSRGSLDAYLFNLHDKQELKFLDWPTRKLIIEGICRGLLYLQRDSRLKIIHRDLKANNILLDEELNPKILDFGMARIFGGKGDQANTNRVVGTNGYMSPEYALQGIFSEKFDVYSFGVLLLEIVSGKKNSSFYDEDHHLFLIAYAWKMWNEGKIVNLMDPMIYSYDGGMEGDIVRYVNVGLLCVQEVAAERPNTSTVLSMLSCEIIELPHPK